MNAAAPDQATQPPVTDHCPDAERVNSMAAKPIGSSWPSLAELVKMAVVSLVPTGVHPNGLEPTAMPAKVWSALD